MRAGLARVMLAGLPVLALAACHRSGSDQNGSIVVPEPLANQAPAPAPASQINLTADRIEPLSAVTPAPQPAGALGAGMQTRKTFTDPPLPAELNDDGGLKPLPPRPHPGG